MTTDIHVHLGETRMDYQLVNQDNVVLEADILISRMNTFGIDKAILTAHGSVECNELYQKAVEAHPDHLFPAYVIPSRPSDKAQHLLREYIDRNIMSIVIDQELCNPQDPATENLIQLAVEHDVPVFYHFDTVGTNALLLIDKMSTMHPTGKFVVLGLGGLFGFPQLLTLSHRDNIWLEISSTLVRLVESPLRIFLDALLQDRGVRSLVFGSEHHSEYQNILTALNHMELNIETSRMIMKENAWVILGVDFS